jgi:hypothetical protein
VVHRIKWVVGVVLVVIPIYRRMRTLEGKPRSWIEHLSEIFVCINFDRNSTSDR